MAPGRPGRIPQLTQILRDRGESMSINDVVKAWDLISKDDPTYAYSSRDQIALSLARAAANSRSTGIIRVKAGVYEYDADALGPNPLLASKRRAVATVAKAASMKRHPAGRQLNPVKPMLPREETVGEYALRVTGVETHDVKFVLDIVGELKDGSLLLKDVRSGKVWIAREV